MTPTRAEIAAQGVIAGRLELRAKGVLPPIDEAHASFYDPPLSVAETRHRFHVLLERRLPVICRFCRGDVADLLAPILAGASIPVAPPAPVESEGGLDRRLWCRDPSCSHGGRA